MTKHCGFDFTHNGVHMYVDCEAHTDWESEKRTHDYPGSLSYETRIDKLNKFIVYDEQGRESVIITGLDALPDEYHEIIRDHIGAIHEED